MIDSKALALALAATIALAACSKAEPPKPVIVYNEMMGTVIPQTQVLWDVSNAAMDDNGVPTASKMTPDSWSKAKTAAAAVIVSLNRLGTAEKIDVIAPGQKIMDQDIAGAPGPADVQAKINANLPGFHKHAIDLAAKFKDIEAAIDKKDFDTFNTKALELDGDCEGCHKAFWLKPNP